MAARRRGSLVGRLCQLARSPGLKADRCLRSWNGQSFVREGQALVACHADGRVFQWGFQGEFSETEQTRHVNGQAEQFTIPAAPPSEGCGGWPVDCLIADGPYAGHLACIRGPWGMSTGTEVSAIAGFQNSLAGGIGADR